jgi:4-hydroxy-tetrahydrodipicolinate reductase
MSTPIVVCGAAGRMGRAILHLIPETPGARLAGAVEVPGHPALGRDAGDLAGVGNLGVEISADLGALLKPGTVALDFTSAAAAVDHLEIAVAKGAAIVIGSTGFDETQQADLDRLAPQTRCVISANMSVGIAVLHRLLSTAAAALGPGFDIEIVEMHHRLKVDAPSGTALALARTAAEATGRSVQTDLRFGRHGVVGKRSDEEIGVVALRGGDVVGDHTIVFAGLGERLELTHRAHTRDCLARGALRAALWVVGQPPGRYSIHDVLGMK